MTERRRVILVVDDEESMRFFLRKTLRREGYEVVEAEDGPAAIEAAQSHPPDLALVDVRMPGMDGVALLRALRATLPHLPVVLMTAYGSVESALHAMKHGATDYVTKPFRLDAIRTTVARALSRDETETRPPTVRDVVPAEPAPPVSEMTTTPAPAASQELPERDLVPYLRERAEARGLPAETLLAGGDLGLREVVRLSELVYVDELLRLTGGNVSRCAEIAGITRPNMHRKVIDLGLSADDYRRAGTRRGQVNDHAHAHAHDQVDDHFHDHGGRTMKPKVFLTLVGLVIVAAVAAAVLWPKKAGVTVYCAVDDVHAIPILDRFEQETGIHVHRVFDTEANKTVGLVTQLREEKGNPRADVFWNNEILHTIRLAREGVIAPYDSPSAADVPDAFRDPDRMWTGIAARARILIVNTELLPNEAERPTSMNDLLSADWTGRAAFVRPLTGTTLTHASVLYTVLGDDGARGWLKGLHENKCHFPSGNGPLARMVAGGQAAFGFTDTDDYEKVKRDGRPVERIYPDQGDGQVGTLLIPNTVALIKDGPRPDLGKQLIDFLLSKEVEEALAHGDSAQIPVRADVKRPPHVLGPPTFRVMDVDWNDVVENFDARFEELNALWRP